MIDPAHNSEPATRADRVRQALLQSWETSSDREIARQLGVSNRTVSKCRRELVAEGFVLPSASGTQSGEASQHEVCTSLIPPVNGGPDYLTQSILSDRR